LARNLVEVVAHSGDLSDRPIALLYEPIRALFLLAGNHFVGERTLDKKP
jgi:hypothetical protein